MPKTATEMRTADREALCACWERIEQGEEAERKGYLFQDLIIRAFELEGARVVWPYDVTLYDEKVEEIDGVVYVDGLRCVVESKCLATDVSFEPIAKLRNQLARRPSSTIGALFSFQGFTNPARLLAQFLAPQTVLLWSGRETLGAMRRGAMISGLHRKFDYATERALPDYNLFLEEST